VQVHQLAATKQQASKHKVAKPGDAGDDSDEDDDAPDCTPPTTQKRAGKGIMVDKDAEEEAPEAVGEECRQQRPRLPWQPQAELLAYIPDHLTGVGC